MKKLPKLENQNFYHIILITTNGAQGERKNGLVHLVEHTCLAPVFQRNKNFPAEPIEVYGETCPHYMALYIAGSLQCRAWMDAWLQSVLTNDVVTPRNVSIARRQILCECEKLKDITSTRQEIIQFVSDQRIQKLPIGTNESIGSISTEEVYSWWAETLKSASLWTFSFHSADELWTQYKPQTLTKAPVFVLPQIRKASSDRFLFLTDATIQKPQAEYLFSLPQCFGRENYLLLLTIEGFLAYILDEKCPVATKVTEKFFSAELGFLSIRLDLPVSPHSSGDNALEWLEFVRKLLHKYKLDFAFFSEVIGNIAEEISQIHNSKTSRSTEENLAQIMSNIVYERPLFARSDAWNIWHFVIHQDISILDTLEKYIAMPSKIIIRLPAE